MSESNESKKTIRRRGAACLYMLLNTVLLLSFLREATVIRGDGPDGFGELILKGIMAYVALGLVAGGGMMARDIYRGHDVARSAIIGAAITAVLMCFAGIAVGEACSDDKGYCRAWRVVGG